MIVLQDVSRVYNKRESSNEVIAVDTVNLEISDNAFVSICGKSGSGKSTLLNLIGGADIPTSGKVIINDVDINKLSDNKLATFRNNTIGFVFQSFFLEPSLTAIENVELPLLVRNVNKHTRTRMAVEMLEQVGLEHRIAHRPYELSGGEKQRVSIARALVTSPEILLADEPTGNLDESTGNDILSLMKKLTSDRTLILVTHDLSEAKLAPTQITMKDGKISCVYHVEENIDKIPPY